jgi:1,4-dihydroxy-2-naphthoate octaprenyltransferase
MWPRQENRMKLNLSMRLLLSWLAIIAGAMTMKWEIGPWFFGVGLLAMCFGTGFSR